MMAGSYALDAVDDAERAAVDAAMSESVDLRAEVDSLRETALLLAYAVEPVEPPQHIKASLMAKIAVTPQRSPQAAHVDPIPSSSVEDHVASVSGVRSAHRGTAAATARSRWFRRPLAMVGVAAAAAALFAAGVGVNELVGDSSPNTTVQASSKLDRIYAASDFQRSSTSVTGGGTATVVWSDDLGTSAVILAGVAAPPAGKTYELWYIGSQITPAGLVDSVHGGTTTAVLDGSKSKGDTIGITVEPAGGSEQPTTDPVAAVPTAT